jgi:hypothetical protein
VVAKMVNVLFQMCVPATVVITRIQRTVRTVYQYAVHPVLMVNAQGPTLVHAALVI